MQIKETVRTVYLIALGLILLYIIIVHFMEGVGLYSIAKRRGIHAPYFAFLPVCNYVLMGRIAEQFEKAQYGRTKTYNKYMLITGMPYVITLTVYLFLVFVVYPDVSTTADLGASYMAGSFTVDAAGVTLFLVTIPFIGAQTLTLYKVFRSLKPDNCALYTILNATVNVVTPFAIYNFRELDLGYRQLGYPEGSY